VGNGLSVGVGIGALVGVGDGLIVEDSNGFLGGVGIGVSVGVSDGPQAATKVLTKIQNKSVAIVFFIVNALLSAEWISGTLSMYSAVCPLLATCPLWRLMLWEVNL
jgi:hypothetical protein